MVPQPSKKKMRKKNLNIKYHHPLGNLKKKKIPIKVKYEKKKKKPSKITMNYRMI